MSRKKIVSFERIGIMIGSPGDTTDERQAITDTILRWNAFNKDQGFWIEPIKWETHSTPGLDGRPQGMINEELIPQSDCLVAVFRARAGSSTGKEFSGTIEEIREFVKAGKYVVVYFYEGMMALKNVDPDQLKLIHEFKKEIQQTGLTENFATIDELKAKLSSQIYGILKKLTSKRQPLVKVASSRKTSLSQIEGSSSKDAAIETKRPIKKRTSTSNSKVDSSDRWILLGDNFMESKSIRQERDGTITVEISSISAEIDASIATLKPHHYGKSKPVPFSHGNGAWIVTVREAESFSEGNGQIWTVRLIPEPIEYGGGSMEMSLITGKKTYSANDLAELRAGRILLNIPPSVDEKREHDSDLQIFEDAFLESHIRGIGTPATVKDCVIRTVYKEQHQRPGDFLKLARLAAIFMLKAGGVVEHVTKLTLGPIKRGKVHVEFVGIRRKKYANVDPHIIRLEGDCLLE